MGLKPELISREKILKTTMKGGLHLNLLSVKLRISVLLVAIIGLGVSANHTVAAPGPSKPGSEPLSGQELTDGPPKLPPYACLEEIWVRDSWPETSRLVSKANDIAVDDEGNVYVAGSTSFIFRLEENFGCGEGYDKYRIGRHSPDEPCGYLHDPTDNVDYLVIKYDPDGNLMWYRTYNGPGDDYDVAIAIAVDGEGNVYVTGVSWGRDSSGDFATIKYSGDGVREWVRRYNSRYNLPDKPVGIGLDDRGNVYVAGWRTVLFLHHERAADYVMIKYQPDGSTAWTRYYIPPRPPIRTTLDLQGAEASDMAVDGDGNVWVTGNFWNKYTLDPNDEFWVDCLTVHLDTYGNPIWDRTYGGPDEWGAWNPSIAVRNGNAYVTGTCTWGSIGSQDYFTIKYDHRGSDVWSQPSYYDGTGNSHDEAADIAIDDDENVYVTGTSAGAGTGRDYATIKYSPTGVEAWVSRYDGGLRSEQRAVALAVDSMGDVCVTGSSRGEGGDWDYATVRYSTTGYERCARHYDGPEDDDNIAKAIALDEWGNAHVTGTSAWPNPFATRLPIPKINAFTTIKYEEQGTRIIPGEKVGGLGGF